MAKTTLKQLAAELGLSVSSVSEILNNKQKRHKPETIERVFKAASDHNYLPNVSAKMMQTNKYRVIGLVTSCSEQSSFIPDRLLRGIQTYLSRHDYHLVFAPVSDKDLTDEKYMPKFLKTWMLDGVLVLYWQNIPGRLLELIEKYDIPAVWINCKQERDCVYLDEFKAAADITKSLIKEGRRRIAFADYSHTTLEDVKENHFGVHERWCGYESTMKAAGVCVEKFAFCVPLSPTKRIDSALEQFKDKNIPDAIIAYSLTTAIPIYSAALKAGLDVPRDLTIVSFCDNDIEVLPFRTFLIPWEEMGLRATELLFRKIDNPEKKYCDPVILNIK